jgi:hypothetical protein
MSGDKHLDEAFASLDDVPVRELMATSEALERGKDGLRDFASIFRQVAHAREGGWSTDLPRFHLRESVSRADDELASKIADARTPFGWPCAIHQRQARVRSSRARAAAESALPASAPRVRAQAVP